MHDVRLRPAPAKTHRKCCSEPSASWKRSMALTSPTSLTAPGREERVSRCERECTRAWHVLDLLHAPSSGRECFGGRPGSGTGARRLLSPCLRRTRSREAEHHFASPQSLSVEDRSNDLVFLGGHHAKGVLFVTAKRIKLTFDIAKNSASQKGSDELTAS